MVCSKSKRTRTFHKTQKHYGGNLTRKDILETLEKFLLIKPLMEKKFPKVNYEMTVDEKFIQALWLAKEIVKGGNIKKQKFKWHPDKNTDVESTKYIHIIEEIFKIYSYVPDVLIHKTELETGEIQIDSSAIQGDINWKENFFTKVEELLEKMEEKKSDAAEEKKSTSAEEKKSDAVEEKKSTSAEEKEKKRKEKAANIIIKLFKKNKNKKVTRKRRRRSITDTSESPEKKSNSNQSKKKQKKPSPTLFQSVYNSLFKKKDNTQLAIKEDSKERVRREYEKRWKQDDEKIRKQYEEQSKQWAKDVEEMERKEQKEKKEKQEKLNKEFESFRSGRDSRYYSRREFEERMDKDREEENQAKRAKPDSVYSKKPPAWVSFGVSPGSKI